jgi:hypothetical protein
MLKNNKFQKEWHSATKPYLKKKNIKILRPSKKSSHDKIP